MTETAAITAPLPEGARLVHIGPHKTGTTALQAALWTARPALLEQGVLHVGRTRNPRNAVQSMTRQPSSYSEVRRPPNVAHWRDLVAQVRGAREQRVVISSEFFAWADPGAIRRIVDDLGGDRVQIAVTLRPLARILPSHWQQDVQAGRTEAFETFLRQMLDPRPGASPHRVWHVQRHDELITRWAAVVGAERLTAVVVDDADRDGVLRAFERLLGIRADTLVGTNEIVNRSLTLPEAESIRAFNALFRASELGIRKYAHVMRFGAAERMKARRPGPDERRIELPPWAAERVAGIAREMVANIRASGVGVFGDLEALTVVPPAGEREDPGDPVPVTPEIAGLMAMAVLESTLAAPGDIEDRRRRIVDSVRVRYRGAVGQVRTVIARR